MARNRPISTATIHTREQFSAYFWSFTDRESKRADQCWIWKGVHTALGYGQFSFRKVRVYAHRAAYELLKGDIGEGLVIDHLCRTPACVNPEHLDAVTLTENTLRGEAFSAKHARKVSCPEGHPYDLIYEHPKTGNKSRHCKTCISAVMKDNYHRSGYFRQRHRRAHQINQRGDAAKNGVVIQATAHWKAVS